MKSPLPMRNIIRRGIAANVSAIYAFSTPTFWLMLVRGRSTAGYWATKVTIFSWLGFAEIKIKWWWQDWRSLQVMMKGERPSQSQIGRKTTMSDVKCKKNEWFDYLDALNIDSVHFSSGVSPQLKCLAVAVEEGFLLGGDWKLIALSRWIARKVIRLCAESDRIFQN